MRPTSPFSPVTRIVSRVAQIQMFWVNTLPIIASMEHIKPALNLADEKSVGRAVRELLLSF